MCSKINASGRKKVIFTLFLAFIFCFSGFVSASGPSEHEITEEHASSEVKKDNENVDIKTIAFEHIGDSHYWHFWGEGHEAVSLPLPCIVYSNTKGLQFFSSSVFEHGHAEYNGYRLVEDEIVSADPAEKVYDFSITKNVMQLFISSALLLWLFISIAKSYKTRGITSAPKGKQSFFEPLITFVRDDIARTNIGPKGERFTPYLLTVFFLILFNNFIGMIPVGANLTGNIAFTFVLSLVTVIVTNVNGNKHYWHHIFAPPVPKPLYIMMIPLELVGILTKPFALMIRLFANMTAGHIVVISLVSLIFMFKTLWIAPISVAFTLFIDVLECLVALLQAYIFTLLTALFIGGACADHDEDGVHTEDDEKIAAQH
jgi:F-type H+-transporting ATPase subunit a